MEVKLKLDQENELNQKLNFFGNNLPDKIKWSTQLLNCQKIFEKAVKQRE